MFSYRTVYFLVTILVALILGADYSGFFVSNAVAAGPAAGSALTVFALEPKTRHPRAREYRSPRHAKVKKKTVVAKRSVKQRATRRVALRSGKSAVARVSHRQKRVTKVHVRKNQKITLDDAFQGPTAEDAVDTTFIRHRSAEPAGISFSPAGFPIGNSIQSLVEAADSAGQVRLPGGETATLTIDPQMQRTAESLLLRYGTPWGALVAMDPKTGAVKAVASYSSHDPNGPEVATRGGFPAASLFKIVTSAAGVEKAGLAGDDMIAFRGGNYTLSHANYVPDSKRDRRHMSLAEAMGRSCNPVFARVALSHFSSIDLRIYAEKFGFNHSMPFDVPIAKSEFAFPADHYEFARTAAGFGDVTVTPVHAASLVGALANQGVMMRPYFISNVTAADGRPLYRAKKLALRGVVRPETAREILNMMQSTVEIGTARKQFYRSFLNAVPIAGKTGTLSGDDPKGTYHWFVAAIPANDPQLVISVLVINPGYSRANSVNIGRQFLERAYRIKTPPVEATREAPAATASGGVS